MGGADLQAMVDFCSEDGNGGIIDEAYEFFHEVALHPGSQINKLI